MFKIRFDGAVFNSTVKDEITAACKLMVQLSEMRGTPPVGLMMEWFGNNVVADVESNLDLMHRVITNKDRTVTFADGRHRQLRIEMNPDNIAEAPVHLTTPVSKSEMKQVGAWVFPTASPSDGFETKYHVGSGMRILLGFQFFQLNTTRERALTIYHEITHKTLGTNDHAYEPDDCRQLALTDSARAQINADSYAHFLTSLDGWTW